MGCCQHAACQDVAQQGADVACRWGRGQQRQQEQPELQTPLQPPEPERLASPLASVRGPEWVLGPQGPQQQLRAWRRPSLQAPSWQEHPPKRP